MGTMEAAVDTNVNSDEQLDALAAAIEGIHNARRGHRILSTFATKADSVMLARAAFDAIQAVGFRIVRQDDA